MRCGKCIGFALGLVDCFPGPMQVRVDEAMREVAPPATVNLRIVSIAGLEVARENREGIRD
jgi:hypothetical protein